MIAVVRDELRELYHSPTRERDMLAIFSPVRLAGWFFILNLVIIGGAALFFAFIQAVGYGFNWMADLGLGRMLAGVIFLSLGAFLTVFVPIRVLGFLMGPRSHRYFDQIVISGITPTRYVSGKIIAQNAWFLIALAATLPYLVLSLSIGGFPGTYLLTGVLILWIYTNVLALVSLSLSTLTNEFFILVLVIAGFGTAFGFGFDPWNPNPLLISPSQVLVSPLFEAAMEESSGAFLNPVLIPGLGFHQSHLIVYLAISLVLCVAAILFLFIGPPNCITKATSTFGEVVMPGDQKRKGFLKKRPGLRLRSEIAFFYENTQPWIRKRDFLLRWLIKQGGFLIALAFAVILLNLHLPERSQRQFLWVTTTWAVILAIFNIILFSQNRATERLKQGSFEAGTLDWMCFFANQLLLFGGLFLIPFSRDVVSSGNVFSSLSINFKATNFVWTGTILFFAGLAPYAILRWISLRFWDKITATVLTTIQYSFLFLFLPLPIYAIFSNLTRIAMLENTASVALFRTLSLAAYLSPVFSIGTFLELTLQNNLHRWNESGALICCIAHLLVGLFFFFRYRTIRKKLEVRMLT